MYPIKMKDFNELLDGRVYLSTDDKVYRLEALTEVENVQLDIRKYFERTLKEMDGAFKKSYNELLEKQKIAKSEGHNKGFKAGMLLTNSLPDGWKIKVTNDNNFVVSREETIYANKISRSSEVTKIPNADSHKFYVKNIEVHVNYDNIVEGGSGYGFNPHFSMNIPTDENGIMSSNFNFDSHKWSLCLGDMQGKELSAEVLKNIEKEMKTINLNSTHGGIASLQAEKIFSKAKKQNKTKRTIWDTSSTIEDSELPSVDINQGDMQGDDDNDDDFNEDE